MNNAIDPPLERKKSLFEVELIHKLEMQYGHIIHGQDLARCLGFANTDALRQAICREKVPIHIFSIEGRRGKFAYTKDVAYWIAALSTTRNKIGV